MFRRKTPYLHGFYLELRDIVFFGIRLAGKTADKKVEIRQFICVDCSCVIAKMIAVGSHSQYPTNSKPPIFSAALRKALMPQNISMTLIAMLYAQPSRIFPLRLCLTFRIPFLLRPAIRRFPPLHRQSGILPPIPPA